MKYVRLAEILARIFRGMKCKCSCCKSKCSTT